MGVDDTQGASDGGVRERRPIHSVQANEHPQPEEGRPMSPVTYQQQWLAKAELLADEQGDSDFIPDQPPEYSDLDSARTSPSDSSVRSSGSWRRSGQFLRTNSGLPGKDQNKPQWRQRLQSTLSPRNSATTAKRAAPPSQVGGETGDVAAQLTALTSKISELQAEVVRLQNESSGTSRPASPSTKPVVPLAPSTASRRPQPEPPRNLRAPPAEQPAVPPPKTPEGAATSAYQSHDNLMTRTPSEFVNSRSSCLPPQRTKEPAVDDGKKETPVSIVLTTARFLTDRGGDGLYWAIARLGEGVNLVTRIAQFRFARGTGNEVEDEEPIAIEYEEWELVNGKPTLAARRWREEHGPAVAPRKGQGHLCIAPRTKSALSSDETIEWEPWELANGKPTLAALRMREEQSPAVMRQERATPMRPALEAHATRISSSRPSPLPTTARVVQSFTPEGTTPKVPAQNLRATGISPTQQPVSAIWIDAVVSTSEPSTSSHSRSSTSAAAPKPSNASRPASPPLKAASSNSAV
jgi:hypothetical protein